MGEHSDLDPTHRNSLAKFNKAETMSPRVVTVEESSAVTICGDNGFCFVEPTREFL
jgi:hypothetical protein